MSKFMTVLTHTYMTKLRTKSFIISTIIVALLLVGVSNLNQIMNLFNKNTVDTIAVLDQTHQLYKPLKNQLDQSADHIKLIEYGQSETKAKADVQTGKLTGYMILKLNASGLPEATYKANKIANENISGKLQSSLQQLKVAMATQKLGLDPNKVAKVFSPVSFHKVALDKGAKSESELNQARGIVYALVLLMFFSVMFYGVTIAMEVATEKSSRVMEILISSVPPVTQMFGKIIGVALLGMTQIAFLFIVGYEAFRSSGSNGVVSGFDIKALLSSQLPASLLIYAIVFFLLGFFLYATLLAMLGSLVNRAEDAQQTMMPVTLMLAAGFYISMFGLADPESTFISVASYIPFFSPMTMLLRIGMLGVPFWQIATSIAILIVSIVFFILIGARIYRGGVLMYGKSSLKNIGKAMTLSKKS